MNWDHFGDDARIASTTGHTAAIAHAANGKGSKKSLAATGGHIRLNSFQLCKIRAAASVQGFT